MKLERLTAIAAALVLGGCVSAPPEKAPEPQRKERTETVRVPVLLKETSFFADGLLDRTITYTYDETKERLMERSVLEPSRPEPTERIVYEYAGGALTSATTYDYEGKTTSKIDYEVDASGRTARETVSDSSGVPRSISKYTYDASGNIATREAFDGTGIPLAVSEYAYSSGRLSKMTIKDSAGQPAGRIEYEYDSEGHLLVRTTQDPSGAVIRKERFAYTDGVLTEEITERGNGRTESRKVYEIGPEGTPTTSILYDGAGRVRDKRTYEYAFRSEERIIVYY